MPKVILTDARVKALRPRRTAYDIRDGKLKGFGVRVLPSGRKRYFVHCQHRGERVWKIVGDAATTNVVDARSQASGMLAAIRRGESTPSRPGETFFEGRRRDRVPALPAGLEAGNAPREPPLSAEPADATFLRPARSPTSMRGRSGTGSLRSARHRSPPTGPCRCFPSSCGRRNGWAFGPRGPTPAAASGGTAGRDASVSCPMTRSAGCRSGCRPHAARLSASGRGHSPPSAQPGAARAKS